ncbi:hypothetical protein GSY71_07130 [Pusillimonas sp. TS35]|uniref:FmdE family protein n=1 Tax=Paracandidimonas lactea TaxID=2895524 RepID=UPI00136EEB99|nr:FmdE family protein [Paracandidimonas lactea]MYN12917.1 hypothetical protein [Pusillimonas sp. TS35]
MTFPAFYDTVPAITLHDPLAHLLGASDDGQIRYGYADVVRLAGHSCPTVAGAYLMTRAALRALYGDAPAQRGAIKAEFRDGQLNGTTGVVANVVSFITGATADNGFKGIRGHHDRRNLLFFDAPINGSIRFTRQDTGHSVTVSFNAGLVPAPAEMLPALLASVEGTGTPEQARAFADMWQDRVRRILEQADNPGLIQVQ